MKFNHFWKFSKQPPHASLEEVLKQTNSFEDVTLPHDWLIYDAKNLFETSSGWYVKNFHFEREEGALLFLRFEGVYMDSTIYLNREKVGEWKNGYTTFEVDLSKYVINGNNELVVQVKHEAPNSRWYSGAGIYRDVWLIKKNADHICTDGIYIHTSHREGVWSIDIETELQTHSPAVLEQCIYDGDRLIAKRSDTIEEQTMRQLLTLNHPILWSVDAPYLYKLETSLIVDGICYDRYVQNIGFKEIAFDQDSGLFLNGKHLKINGVCEHHDLGSLGAAFNKPLMKKRMLILKDMGVNAIRTAHSVFAPAFMDLADELGFLVLSEAFDMWERPKTKYDYSRFFKEWVDVDVQSWIRRDRNHVSLMMWSIGNEIYDTHIDTRGLEITKALLASVLKHDPKHNGKITIASNFMTGENAKMCSDVLKYAGYNYLEKLYEEHHREHPDWLIYGSETGSVVQSRGIYHFPLETPILADDDLQCSALGNSVTSWGSSSIEKCITGDRDLRFSMGQFVWTGFDYLGEPTPYATKNAYFGQVDTAGFVKDSYFVYQSAWRKFSEKPVVHLYPYWQFNEGQMIDVRCCTNASKIKVFLNDRLLGERIVDMTKDIDIIPTWKIPFEKGELKAIAYDQDDNEVARVSRNSFQQPVELVVNVDEDELQADGEDVSQVTISTLDIHGYPVEDCKLPVKVEVEGPGVLLGLDNGDSTDYDQFKGNTKRMFSGKLKAFVGSTLNKGTIHVIIQVRGLPTKMVSIKAKEVQLPKEAETAKKGGHPLRSGQFLINQYVFGFDKIPIQRIELIAPKERILTKVHNEIFVAQKIHPNTADYSECTWKAVTEKGVHSNIAKITPVRNGCIVSAIGDGKFILKCMTHNGKNHPDIISQLDFEAMDIGIINKDPYQYVSAGLFDDYLGEIGAGNDKGIATDSMNETILVYHHLDFGDFGSDTLTISLFAFDSQPQNIEVYLGDKKNNNPELLETLHYDLKTIWNVYQDMTFKIPRRISGIQTLSFVFHTRNHFRGFSFQRLYKAYAQLSILDCDAYYGDSLTIESWGVSGIGNNVSFTFQNMNFSEPVDRIQICGRSVTDKNTIRIQSTYSERTQEMQIVEFDHTEDFAINEFPIETLQGNFKIEFIFLPGSNFDFKWFRFIKRERHTIK